MSPILTPEPGRPVDVPARMEWPRTSSNTARCALKPEVLTLAMLSPTTPRASLSALRPETPEFIDDRTVMEPSCEELSSDDVYGVWIYGEDSTLSRSETGICIPLASVRTG